MSPLLFASTFLLLFSAISLLASLFMAHQARASADRVFVVTRVNAQHAASPQRASSRLQQRALSAVAWARASLHLGDNPKLTQLLAGAGFRSAHARDTFFAARTIAPLAAVFLASLIPTQRAFWMMALGGTFYLAPAFILERIVKRRREKLRLSIPDAIDLLVICVDAGLGIDQAMLRVGHELATTHAEMYEEFMQINREQRAGQHRIDAWRDMAARCRLPELDGFVEMLLQTERFGTPIAKALREFGDGIRQKRRQRAEELAAKTTVKIIFPLVLFIFPSLFIVLLGPAGINIARGLTSSTH